MRGHAFRPFDGDQVALLGREETHHEISCFADEVVIDFPSVAPVVERMRRPFVADEHPLTFPMAVQLTAREAVTGATLPLEVPVRCTCRHCGGRGESWTEACAGCGGEGIELLRHLLQVTVPAGVCDGTRFYFTVTPRHSPSTRIELAVFIDPAD